MSDKVREVISMMYLDDESFDIWREAMDEFEKTHTSCSLGMEPGDYCYGQSDPDFLAFSGYRDKTEVEKAKEQAALAEKERLARIKAAQEAKDKEIRELKSLERARLMSEPDYGQYVNLERKFGKLKLL